MYRTAAPRSDGDDVESKCEINGICIVHIHNEKIVVEDKWRYIMHVQVHETFSLHGIERRQRESLRATSMMVKRQKVLKAKSVWLR